MWHRHSCLWVAVNLKVAGTSRSRAAAANLLRQIRLLERDASVTLRIRILECSNMFELLNERHVIKDFKFQKSDFRFGLHRKFGWIEQVFLTTDFPDFHGCKKGKTHLPASGPLLSRGEFWRFDGRFPVFLSRGEFWRLIRNFLRRVFRLERRILAFDNRLPPKGFPLERRLF